MSGLQDARIDQLPDSAGPKGYYYLAMYNLDTNRTERIAVSNFTPSETSQDFEWITDNGDGYAIDEVVTFNGKWWQSLVNNNLNNTPGVDATKWEEMNRGASGFVFWEQDAVYVDEEVFVLKEINNSVHIVRLNPDTPRPFVSSDFEDEIENGDWLLLGQLVYVEVATAGATITLDFASLEEMMFRGDAIIDEPKTWVFTHATNARKLSSFRFEVDDLHAQTMPSNVFMSDARFDRVTKVWTPMDPGSYEAIGTYDGVEWWIIINGPFKPYPSGD